MTRVVLVLVLLAGCSRQWVERGLLVENIAVIGCDRGQTQWMANGGAYDRGLFEANPLLGRTPSPMRIDAMNFGAIGAVAAGYRVLPPKLRLAMLISVALLETLNVTTNPDGGRNRPFCGL